MAILSVDEIWNGRRGSHDEKATVLYVRVFRVITNDPLTSSYSVRYAEGIPVLFDLYEDADGTIDVNSGATVRRVSERQTEDPYVWEVEVEYSNKTDDPQQGELHPLLRPAEVKITFERYQRAITQDLNGDAMVNTAGEPFDPPVEIDDSRFVLRISQADLLMDATALATFRDAVNTSVFYGFAVGTVKLSGIDAERAFEQGIFYWKLSYEFHVDPKGWDKTILDQGYYELDDSVPPKRMLIRDKYGNPLTAPALLDGNGKQLAHDAAPVYIQFTTVFGADFSLLRLRV